MVLIVEKTSSCWLMVGSVKLLYGLTWWSGDGASGIYSSPIQHPQSNEVLGP